MKIPEDSSISKKVTLLCMIIGIFIVILYVSYLSGKSLLSSSKEDNKVFVTTVEESKLVSDIPVYGVLKPEKITSVIALVKGTVTEIHARAGDHLSKGDPIISIANPHIVRKFEEMKLLQLEQETEHQKLLIKLNQDEETLINQLAMATLEYQLVQVEQEAKQELFQKNIISRIAFKKIKLQTAQGKGKESLAKSKLNSFYIIKEKQIETSKLRLKQAEQKVALSELDKNSLVIKANMKGVLNDLNDDIQLGNQIMEGRAVGQITDPKKLYAELEISSAYISDVQIKQSVALNIKGSHMKGTIKRIAPNVLHNKVKVDVVLIGELVNTARANIEVTGTLILKETELSLTSEKPQFIHQKNKYYQLYVKSKNQLAFELKQVKVGSVSGNKMELLDGVKAGDLILISVPKELQGERYISLEQLSV